MSEIKRRMRREVKEIKEEVKSPSVTKRGLIKVSPNKLIPTGSTLLNLCCSDRIEGGYVCGKMVNIIGDSAAGKTMLALSMLAEIANTPRFDDYLLIYDEPEYACQFDIRYLFGNKVADRIIDFTSDEERSSVTIEDFYSKIVRFSKNDTPFIYVLDSLDALTTEEEQKRANTLAKKGEMGGSYKTEKPRLMSELLRECVDRISNTKSLLVVISQTRDKIGVTFGQKKTRSGGRALKFYLTHELWLSVVKSIKVNKRDIGSDVAVRVSKNKLTGKKRNATFNIYNDYGIDDIGSCIDFLVDESHWAKRGRIDAKEFEIKGFRKDLIQYIEANNLEKELHKIVQTVWDETEEQLRLNRKPKYE